MVPASGSARRSGHRIIGTASSALSWARAWRRVTDMRTELLEFVEDKGKPCECPWGNRMDGVSSAQRNRSVGNGNAAATFRYGDALVLKNSLWGQQRNCICGERRGMIS